MEQSWNKSCWSAASNAKSKSLPSAFKNLRLIELSQAKNLNAFWDLRRISSVAHFLVLMFQLIFSILFNDEKLK